MKARAIIFLFGIITCMHVSAQKDALLFENYNSEQGLSQNSGYAITQDQQGFIWIGTQDGLNSALIIFAVYMGFKQGWAMFSGDPKMPDMFSKWNFSKAGVTIFGVITMVSTLLILFPKTFVIGNFLMATTILLIICFHLSDKDLKGASIELPFFILNIVIIYFQHPLGKTN
jgi:hypothetical protein